MSNNLVLDVHENIPLYIMGMHIYLYMYTSICVYLYAYIKRERQRYFGKYQYLENLGEEY